MTPQDFLLEVFCFVDDELQALTLGRLRARGPQPALADSEVIAIELVGEFWGLDTDKALFCHFRCYHRGEFPALAHVSRTTFARQAAAPFFSRLVDLCLSLSRQIELGGSYARGATSAAWESLGSVASRGIDTTHSY